MAWLHTVQLWLLAGAAALATGLAFHAWQRRGVGGARPFAVIMLAVAVWSFAAMAKLLSASQSAQQFWIDVGFLGVVTVSPAWLVFSVQYTGRDSWLHRSTLALLSVIPAVTLVLVVIPATQGLVLKRAWIKGVFHESYGGWFWVFAGFAYLCNLLSLVLMLLKLAHSPPLYRQQTVVILLGGLAPWIANLLHLAGVFPEPSVDPTPFCFALSGVALAWGLFYSGLLDIMPVARDQVIEHMSDAMLVFDTQDRIVDVNPAAQRLFQTTARRAIGRTAEGTLGGVADIIARLHAVAATQTEAALGQGQNRRDYDLRVSPLFDRRNQLVGRLVVLRDITRDKQAERERERLIRDLQEALSNLKILSGLLPICASCKKIRDDRGYWNQLETYLSQHSDVQFTHGLCPDCVQRLYPELSGVGGDPTIPQRAEPEAHDR